MNKKCLEARQKTKILQRPMVRMTFGNHATQEIGSRLQAVLNSFPHQGYQTLLVQSQEIDHNDTVEVEEVHLSQNKVSCHFPVFRSPVEAYSFELDF